MERKNLKDFVNDAKHLVINGIIHDEKHYDVHIFAFICDVPAKSFIKCTRGHSGYMSCTKCYSEGTFKENRICFPGTEGFRLRTDTLFRLKDQESHHTNTSILEEIPGLDMVHSFPLDYMHLVCLGVMKKLINNLWLGGTPPYKLANLQVQQISSMHLSFAKLISSEFTRKPRSLSEIKRWKATELRCFLFYTGAVVLKDHVDSAIYVNFLSLHVALTLLSKNVNVQYAKYLLKYFVNTFATLYGEQHISHNIHNLLHIADDVNIFGSIENFAAFPYENNMLFLKKLVRKGDQPLQQIVNRIYEQKNTSSSMAKNNKNDKFPLVKGEHARGPLIENVFGIKQFENIYLKKFQLSSSSESNNCCMLKDKNIINIKNIISYNDKVQIIGQKFRTLEDFYESPCKSSKLGIFLASNMGGPLELWELSEICEKYVKLPYKNKYVLIPLLHTST